MSKHNRLMKKLVLGMLMFAGLAGVAADTPGKVPAKSHPLIYIEGKLTEKGHAQEILMYPRVITSDGNLAIVRMVEEWYWANDKERIELGLRFEFTPRLMPDGILLEGKILCTRMLPGGIELYNDQKKWFYTESAEARIKVKLKKDGTPMTLPPFEFEDKIATLTLMAHQVDKNGKPPAK